MHSPQQHSQPAHALPTGLTLLAIRQPDGGETLAVHLGDTILDLRAANRLLDRAAPLAIEDMLRDGTAPAVAALVEEARRDPRARDAFLSADGIRYGRLFTRPGKILCVGLNYRRHAREVGMPVPKKPVLFSKFNNALSAHGDSIALPPDDISRKIDYETELLVVIGKAARSVSEAEAGGHIAGYCVANDLSARDLQLESGGQWLIGKTLDGFAPIGPWFVSADLVGDPNALSVETRVNGEVRQSSTTADFIFNVQQIVAYISRHWTLEPGDIIFTGTPEGVIAGMPKEKQVWLKPGDVVESRIDRLGTLRVTLS